MAEPISPTGFTPTAPSSYEIGAFLKTAKTAKENAQKRMLQLNDEYEQVRSTDPYKAEEIFKEFQYKNQGLKEVEQGEVEARKLASSLLATGKFRFEGANEVPKAGEMRPAGYKPPTIKDKLKAHLAFSLGVDENGVDVDSELPFTDRLRAAFFTADKKPAFYKDKYGEENVVTVKIDGKPANLVKIDGKFVLADSPDTTFKDVADVAGGIGGEALPVAGAIIGGVSGAPGVATSAGGSAAGYMAGGTISDFVMESLFLGKKDRRGFGDIVGKRSLEAAIGLPIDAVGGQLMKPAAMRIGQKAKNPLVESMDDALATLERRSKITRNLAKKLEPLANTDEYTSMRMLQVAQKRPYGEIGRPVFKARALLQEFRDGIVNKETGLSKKLYQSSAKQWLAEQEGVIARIRQVNGQLASVMEREMRDKAAKMMEGLPMTRTEELGTTIRNLAGEAEKSAMTAEKAAYDPFFEQADNSGIYFNPDELAQLITRQYSLKKSEHNSVIEDKVKSLLSRKENAARLAELESSIPQITDPHKLAIAKTQADILRMESGPIDAREFRAIFKSIRDDAPAGQLVAPTGAASQARNVSTAMNDLFHNRLQQAGLSDQWNVATNELQKRLGFEAGVLKSVLKDDIGGGAALTPQAILNKTLSDPTYTRTVLDAVKTVDAESAEQLRYQMQRAYLERVGVGADNGSGMKQIDFDPDTVMTLWGVNKRGVVNENFGKAMVEKLKTLNSELKKLNIDPSKVSDADIEDLYEVLSPAGIKETVGLISKKAAEKMKQEAFENNEMMKLAVSSARQGDPSIIDADAFPRAIFAEKNTGRVSDLVKLMEPADQTALKTETMAHFFRRYGVPDELMGRDFGYAPWDVDKFLGDLNSNKALGENLKKVIGDNDFDDLVEMSKLASLVRPVKVDKKMAVSPRMVAAGGKASVYLAGDIPGLFRDRYLTSLYMAGQLTPTLRNAMTKRVSQEQFEQNMKNAQKYVLGTTKGMEALFMTGRKDPAFMEFVADTVGGPEWMQEMQEFNRQYGTETGLDIRQQNPEYMGK
jgi:hypothetical protein